MSSNNTLSFSETGTESTGKPKCVSCSAGDDSKSAQSCPDAGASTLGCSAGSVSTAEVSKPLPPEGMKVCKSCGRLLRLELFSRHIAGGRDYRNSRCNQCRALRQRTSPAVDDKREMIRLLKAAPCACCGQQLEPECMELRHLPGAVKLANIGSAVYWFSRDKLKAELAKCEALCGSCVKLSPEHRAGRKLADVPRAGAAAEITQCGSP